MYLIDFDKRDVGYKPFTVSTENLKKNIGKRICCVDYVEPYRGTYFTRYGIIHSIKHYKLFLNNGDKEVDITKIKEAGIEI